AGIVEQAIDTAKAGEGVRDHALPVVFYGRIGGNELRLGADPGGNGGALGLATAREDHARPPGNEQFGRARADAAGATGNDGDFAVDHTHAPSLCWSGLLRQRCLCARAPGQFSSGAANLNGAAAPIRATAAS